MKLLVLLSILFLLYQPASPQQGRRTYDVVVGGMNCHQNLSRDMECNYRVGRSLHFGIVSVGQKDASIYFYSAAMDGDYFAVFGLSHGCVVVKPGLAMPQDQRVELAFVSPRNGRVYQTWQTCGEAK